MKRFPEEITKLAFLKITNVAKKRIKKAQKTIQQIGLEGKRLGAVTLEKKNKKVVLRVVSHQVVAADSLPVSEAVVNSNFEPDEPSLK